MAQRYPTRRTRHALPLTNNTNTAHPSHLSSSSHQPAAKKPLVRAATRTNIPQGLLSIGVAGVKTALTADVTANDVTANDVKANDVTANDVKTNDVIANDVTIHDSLKKTIQIHLHQKNLTSAIFFTKALHSLCIKSPQSKTHLFSLAEIYFTLGEYQQTLHLIVHNHIHSGNTTALHLACRSALYLKLYNDAQELLSAVNDTELSSPNKATHNYLLGKCHQLQTQNNDAKTCYEKALFADVTCFEAFKEIISCHLMTVQEQYSLIEALPFISQVGAQQAEFYILLYKSQINQYIDPNFVGPILQQLEEKFNLKSNSDIHICKARSFLLTCQYSEALSLVNNLLKTNPYEMECIEIQISCLYHQKQKNNLYFLSHELVHKFPNNHLSWFAVASYYLLIDKFSDARRYFAKCTNLLPQWGPGWIGFGHAIAAEGEYDQAIHAYATASKFMPESHLPSMFIGSQYLLIHNLILAQEFLLLAKASCSWDPHLENELGVCYFRKENYKLSIKHFESVLDILGNVQSKMKVWGSVWSNLAHAYLRTGDLLKAKEIFVKIISFNANSCHAYSGLATVEWLEDDTDAALNLLHKALSCNPEDVFASEMLDICIARISVSTNQANSSERFRTPSPLKSRIAFTSLSKIESYLKSVGKRTGRLKQSTKQCAREPLFKSMHLPIELQDDAANGIDAEEDWLPAFILERMNEEKDREEMPMETNSLFKKQIMQQDGDSDMDMDF